MCRNGISWISMCWMCPTHSKGAGWGGTTPPSFLGLVPPSYLSLVGQVQTNMAMRYVGLQT